MSSIQSLLMPLTPVKTAGRRKKLSLSPVKTATALKTRTTSEQGPQKPIIEDTTFYVPTAALNFREFSFWNESENCFGGISSQHMEKFMDFMAANYGVYDAQLSGPYIVLRTNDIPAQDMRPFTICGCLAIWLTETQPLPYEWLLGSQGTAPAAEVGEEEVDDLKLYWIPKTSTILSVWENHFPDAEAITYVATGLLVELPETDLDHFRMRLNGLPRSFAKCAASLEYINGPLVKHEMGRLKQPQPNKIHGQYDDLDYMESEQCFYPGTMIMNSDGDMVSAGIAVEKSNDFRVTAAFHCWEAEYNGHKNRMGELDFMTVTQGKTIVGNVTERIANTDIGLTTLKPKMAFNNRFLGIDAVPKVLIPLCDVKYGDEFIIDGFTTSVQRLKCFGTRWRRESDRAKDLYNPDNAAELLAPGRYVILKQGVMATGEPEMRGPPMIREGVCGSALLRVQTAGREDVTQKGQIAAFMHWCDLQSLYSQENRPPLLCYCDSVEELIDDGWKVVQAGEKRKAED